MEICKFNGNSTASVEGMQHVAKLINEQPAYDSNTIGSRGCH